MAGAGTAPGQRLLDPQSTAAVVFGAHDWTDAGLGRAPSFLRSARGVVAYLYDQSGLWLDPDLVLDFFDSGAGAGEQLAEIRDGLDARLRERRGEGRPVTDVLVYYVGHGHTDDQGHLSLLVRRSRRGMEAETGIKAPDLARVLKVAAPQQRRIIVLDCCFSEAAARGFIGMSPTLDQAVAATAAKDLGDDQPRRGTLLLCSSPVGEVSMGPPNAARTLFTGAVLDVLRQGAEGKPPALSFADLRDAAYGRMVESFGANTPRPVLHQVNAAQGDLTRTPAFPNRDHARREEETRREVEKQPQPAPGTADPGSPTLAAGTVTQLAPTSPPSPPERAPQWSGRERSFVGFAVVVLGFVVASILIMNRQSPLVAPSSVSAAERAAAEEQARREAVVRREAAAEEQARLEAARRVLAEEQARLEASFAASRRPEVNFLLGQQREREGNDAEAVRLYRVAADQGNAWAQNRLGVLYEQGRGGLPKDDVQAARFYRLAADQSDASAQHNLGLFYEQGRGGLLKNFEEAVRWYQRAAQGGNASSEQRLRLLGRTW